MDGKASRQPIVWQVGGEIAGVRLRVGTPQPSLRLREASRIDERVGTLGLAAEGVNLEKVDVAQRLADAGLLQPLLLASKNERDLAFRIHRHELVATEDVL